MNKRTIVFAPHPDDETLGCGGTIAKRISEAYDVLIVVMTDGRHAFYRSLGMNSNPSPEELRLIRIEEMVRAAEILGVSEENIILLNFEDGTLEKNSKEAEERVTHIISETRPTEVFIPYEKDHHTDHRATNRIVRGSIKRLGLPISEYQYSIYQKYSRIRPVIDKSLNFLRHNVVQVDISDFLSVKERAIKEFKSEITMISSKQTRPVLADSTVKRHLKNKEMFYID